MPTVTQTQPPVSAVSSASIAARKSLLLQAYGLSPAPAGETAQLLSAAHQQAQTQRFAASPSFAAMLDAAVARYRAGRGAA